MFIDDKCSHQICYKLLDCLKFDIGKLPVSGVETWSLTIDFEKVVQKGDSLTISWFRKIAKNLLLALLLATVKNSVA